MLLDILPALKSNYNIILASGSVNRRDILKNAGLDHAQGHFTIDPSNFAEDLDKSSFKTSKDYVIKTSECKLDSKVNDYTSEEVKEREKLTIVISADTIISLNESEVMEKPRDADHAVEMLLKLKNAKVH